MAQKVWTGRNRMVHAGNLGLGDEDYTSPSIGVRVVTVALLYFAATPPVIPRQVTFSFIALCALFVFAGKNRRYATLWPRVIMLLLVLMVSSTLWSASLSATLANAYVMVVGTAAAVLLAVALDRDQIVSTVFDAMRLISAVCVAYWIMNPGAATVQSHYQAGALQGIFEHRNVFAYTMVLGVIAALSAKSIKGRLARLLWVSWFLALVFAASSSTALILAVSSIILWVAVRQFAYMRTSLRFLFLVFSLSLTMPAVLWSSGDLDVLTAAFGRDATFTGRTIIWEASVQQIQRSPWLGYGWGAVWGDSDTVGNEIRSYIGFRVIHAHNGFLDIALQLGVFSGLLISAVLVVLVVRGLAQTLRGASFIPSSSWVVLVGFVMVMYSFVETRVTHPIGWIVVVLAATAVGARDLKPVRSIVSAKRSEGIPSNYPA